MRTNIEIDDTLIKKAQRLSKVKSKKDVVNLALEELVNSLKRKEMLTLRGKVKWEGNLTDRRQL
jgi:Arc/MetJ family transcription regulator